MATIGKPLTAPESGWQRFDNKDGKFIFSGSWGSSVNSNHWNGEGIYNGSADANSKITFRFYGTKLRWIGFSSSAYHSAVKITIDGISETFSSVGNEVYQALQYEKTGLSLGVHTVEVSANSVAKYFYFDAIDVDSGGYIMTTLLGEPLVAPESGWKRYDDTNTIFQYLGTWTTYSNASYFGGSHRYSKTLNDEVKFIFSGTKLRIIGILFQTASNNLEISIDGVKESFSMVGAGTFQPLNYEKIGLVNKKHEVIITNKTTGDFYFDAIDIDSTGRLLHPNEVTSINDLDIGKRIRCHYQAYTGAVGTFSGLGKETSDFIPVTSSATPDGDFYYIMVEDWNGQKRLIADRNVQHSISYDVLNSTGIASGSGVPLTEIQGIGFFSSVVYVNPINGSDTNSGSYTSPVKTINKALEISIQGGAIRLLDGIHTINTTNMSLHDLCTIKGITFVGNDKKTILEVPSCLGAYAQGVGTSAYFYNMIIRRSDSGLGDARMLWYSSNVDFKLRFYNVGFAKSPNGSFPSGWHFVWSPNVLVNNNAYFDNCSFVATPTNVESGSTTDVVRYRNCAFGNSTVSSKTLGSLFNSTFDSSSTLNITSGNWMKAGVGYNSDGTAMNIGVYGGGYNWSTFVVNQMDTEHKLTVRLPTGGVMGSDKDNEWDKYVVNSTLNGLITAGDNSVWNWNAPLRSWTSSTNEVGNRQGRGYSSGVDTKGNIAPSSGTTGNGFRPTLLIDSQLLNKSFISFNGEYKKWIEGTPATEESFSLATPKMTSNTTPSGRVFSETVFSSAYDAWMVFNQVDDGEGYASGNGTGGKGFLGYQFPSAVMITRYVIRSMTGSNHLDKMPKDWSFEGSNDSTNGTDGTWIVLDSRTSQIWTTITTDKEYSISNPQSFLTYRLRWTANNGVASYTDINELKMYSYTPYVPAIPSTWKTISTTLPSVDTFKSEGMSDLSVLDRKPTTFTFPMDDNGVSGTVLGGGKVFKEKVDLKRFFDINSVNVK
ncbi:hypothetical protein [Paenibacillus odorifer]|uniref:hypothetical protein n=1 Tax=Paenibacillus odorifer TaxID=189426 RepID=UPI00096C2639|nr:hypothetical protein [Paenibacillus odorifer]OMD71238.1 hypothetical protein BSK50_26530 [Paenibacillus odorifer]